MVRFIVSLKDALARQNLVDTDCKQTNQPSHSTHTLLPWRRRIEQNPRGLYKHSPELFFIKPQSSRRIYLLFDNPHRCLQFTPSPTGWIYMNQILSTQCAQRTRTLRLSEALEGAAFLLWHSPKQMSWLSTSPQCTMLLTPHGSGGWAPTLHLTPTHTHMHINTLTERCAALLLFSHLPLWEFPPDTHVLNNQGVECMHGL